MDQKLGSNKSIIELIFIVSYDIMWYRITVEDACQDEVHNYLFLDLF